MRFRTGTHNPYTIYLQEGAAPSKSDPYWGSLNRPEFSAQAVAALNFMLSIRQMMPTEMMGQPPVLPAQPATQPAATEALKPPAVPSSSTEGQCPNCGRTIKLRHGKLTKHKDRAHGGVPCPGRIPAGGDAPTPAPRKGWSRVPPNFAEQLARHGGSAASLALELGVSRTTVQSRKDKLMKKLAAEAAGTAKPTEEQARWAQLPFSGNSGAVAAE